MTADTELRTILRLRGNRVTEPRRLVWQVLLTAGGHLTVEEITARVHEQDPAVNLSSVYRTLALFAEMGLVRESNLGTDGASRWEPAHPDEHFHLVCESCGEVDHHVGDLVEQVRAHLADGHGFQASGIDLIVTGRCPRCAPG